MKFIVHDLLNTNLINTNYIYISKYNYIDIYNNYFNNNNINSINTIINDSNNTIINSNNTINNVIDINIDSNNVIDSNKNIHVNTTNSVICSNNVINNIESNNTINSGIDSDKTIHINQDFLKSININNITYTTLNNNIDFNKDIYIRINLQIYILKYLDNIDLNIIYCNKIQRRNLSISINEEIDIELMKTEINKILKIDFILDYEFNNPSTYIKKQIFLNYDKLLKIIKNNYNNHIFRLDQSVSFEFNGYNFTIKVININNNNNLIGKLLPDTIIGVIPNINSLIKFLDNGALNIFKDNFNFEEYNIGGLNTEFYDIIRRVFISRMYSKETIKNIGITHVKGLLLYGPSGCGKTLIARQIGKMLNVTSPKIINGPEILNKYVGESESKIRELFKDAEHDMKYGLNNKLHMIIFDEIDSICKKRGTKNDSAKIHDTIVNQLLAKMDGINQLDNILIIGLTNRKDMIDDALLRPGRFEVHMEIGLPNEKGRLQILNIYTKSMKKNGHMDSNLIDKIPSIATKTINYTGAEIEGLVRSATSYALKNNVDFNNLNNKINNNNVLITEDDFDLALKEIKPFHGIDTSELNSYHSNGIIVYNEKFNILYNTLLKFINNINSNKSSSISSILFAGDVGSGKTALSTKIALESNFTFVRIITIELLLNETENEKLNYIYNIFSDAYKSSSSLIIIDDIEKLIEYVEINRSSRFNNHTLQLLLNLMKNPPTNDYCNLCVICTTSYEKVLKEMDINKFFDLIIPIPSLTQVTDIKTILNKIKPNIPPLHLNIIVNNIYKPIGIKKIITILNMIYNENDNISDITPKTIIHYLDMFNNENNYNNDDNTI